MAEIELSEKNLPTLKAPETGQPYLWDTHRRGQGLGVRISADGKKRTFYFKYRFHGHQRWLRLGVHGPMTLEQARDTILQHKANLAKGKDPAEVHVGVHRGLTVAEAWEAYRDERHSPDSDGGKRKPWKPKTLMENSRAFRNHIIPSMGERGLMSITPEDVRAMRDNIAAGKLQVKRKKDQKLAASTGRRATADRSVAYLSGMFSWAITNGHYKRDNPCNSVGRLIDTSKDEDKRKRVMSDDEFNRYLDALDDANDANPYAVAALRLYLMTGCRREELLQLRWENVRPDLSSFEVVNGKSGNRAISLSEPASDLLRSLRALPQKGENPYVFCGDVEGQHLVNVTATHRRICAVAGIDNLTIHDLRRTYGTLSLNEGADIYVLSNALGHKSVTTTQRVYAIIPEAKIVDMNAKVGGRFTRRRKRECNVVGLKRQA